MTTTETPVTDAPHIPWPVHPAADLFPLISDDELAELADDIDANGLIEPIWLYDDPDRGEVLLDGRNRVRACALAEVELDPDEDIRWYDGDEPVTFVVSANLKRRHLTKPQRDFLAVDLEPLFAEQARRRQAHGQTAPGKTLPADRPEASSRHERESREQAAAAVGTSGRSVSKAKNVAKEAPDLADKAKRGEVSTSAADAAVRRAKEIDAEYPDLAAALRAGNMTDREADQEIRKRVKDAERRERERLRDEATAAMSAAMAADGGDLPDDAPPAELSKWWQLGDHLLYCGDSSDAEFVEACAGAKLAFADPPYNAGKADWDRGFVWEHDYLTDVADVVLVTPGISAIADFFKVTAMRYRWSVAAYVSNGMTRGALGFGNWIYVALFSEADSVHRNAQDHMTITVDATTTTESGHQSRKPARLLINLIELFTVENDLVVDPFLGSGTTLFAAEELGRRCVCAELDPTFQAEIIARWNKAHPDDEAVRVHDRVQ